MQWVGTSGTHPQSSQSISIVAGSSTQIAGPQRKLSPKMTTNGATSTRLTKAGGSYRNILIEYVGGGGPDQYIPPSRHRPNSVGRHILGLMDCIGCHHATCFGVK